MAVRSADELLTRGIGDFTYVQGDEGILGKGKFSTVFKVHGAKDMEVRHIFTANANVLPSLIPNNDISTP